MMDRKARLALVLAGALGMVSQAALGERIRMITPVTTPVPQTSEALGVSSGATPIRLDRAKASRSRIGDTLEINLPNATTHEYVFDMLKPHGADSYSWVGYHRSLGPDYRAIITTGPAGSFGTIRTADGEYRIIPGHDGQDWLVDMKAEARSAPGRYLADDMRIPPPQAKRDLAGVPSFKRATPGVDVPMTSLAIPTRTVDVMFLYTRGLANRLGGALMTRLNFLMTQANVAYAASGADIGVRMVIALMVEYPDSGTSDTALNAVTPGGPSFNPSIFGGVEGVRNAYGADLVALLRNGSSFGGDGIAWLGSGSPNPSFMYSVTTGCVLGCESVFIHELGHNMGNRHDRDTQTWQNVSQGLPAPVGGSNFGYAFCATPGLTCTPATLGSCTSQPECLVGDETFGAGNNNFADIMAYFDGSTTSNLKFSNPLVTCSGDTGPPLPCGTADANAAGTLTANATAISAVKTQQVPDSMPGYLSFPASTFGALEAGGALTFGVARSGGTNGTASVSYTITNGSAVAGQDFTGTNGVVSWANGEGGTKNVIVPLVNDGLNEEGKFFTITLSNPAAGVGGLFMGFPTTAYGVIVDTWPLSGSAGGPVPGMTGNWTLANDKLYEGPLHARSASPMPGNSDMTITAAFRDGPVYFAYKVSSYQGFGNLEFSVDGVTVLTASGEAGYTEFTYPLTAGTHTLRWRFANQLSFPCKNAINPSAVGGANCADRAWIDALVLPLATGAKLSDTNGDGRSDIVYRNNTTGQVYRLFANGLSLTGGAMVYTEADTQWRVIADGDFNGDGVSDLLWRHATNGQVYVMPFNASGVPTAGAIVYTEANAAWRILHTPDLDGDGKADLLWYNTTTGQVYATLMNGLAVGAQGMVYSEPNTQWRIVAVGDFSGSGKKNQLLWRNATTGQVYMMTVAFSGTFSQTGQMVYNEPNTAWTIIGAPDLNGDGKSDILYRNTATGQVYGLLMNAGAVTGSGQLHVEPSTAWKVISHGDYNGDGRSDLLWRNDATGQVYMMLVGPTGLAIQSQGSVYNEPNTAWRILGPYEFSQ